MIRDLLSGWAEMQAALPAYEAAEEYFDGEVGEVFASQRVRTLIESTGENYRFNLAKTPVKVMADRVELIGVTAPGNEAASRLIEQMWDANDMDVHYPHLILKTFEYGDAYLQVWPVEQEDQPEGDETEAPADDELLASGVELNVHNPKNCRVIYDPEHPRRKAYAMKRWPIRDEQGAEVWRVDLWYPDAVERWVSKRGCDTMRSDGWDMYLDDDQDPESWLLENPFGEIPFVHYRNDIPYGRPEHADGYGCQNAITKMLVTLVNTTDSHGWPQRYAMTDRGAELDTNMNSPDWEDDADTDETLGGTTGGASSQLRSGPGTMMVMDGMKGVGQFDAADPAVFLDPTQVFVRLMSQITTTPAHYFDPSGDVPSGESLKTADAPLVRRARWAIKVLKGAVAETWLLALRMRGARVDRIESNWAPIQSADGLDDWQVVRAKQEAGVPQGQTLIEAGYEAEQVAEWLNQDAEAMDLFRRVEILDKLGDAITKLGAGVGSGILSQEDASNVIAGLIPQAAPEPGSESLT